MVFGHALVKKQSVAIIPIDNDPRRINMSKADVLAEKAIEAKKKVELDEAKKKIDEKYKDQAPKIAIPVSDGIGEKIAKLRKEQNLIKGPGSKDKRAKIQEEINALSVPA